jgi:hypothetical protein
MHSFLLLTRGTVLRGLHSHAQLFKLLNYILGSNSDGFELLHVVLDFLRFLPYEVLLRHRLLWDGRFSSTVMESFSLPGHD